MEKANVSTVFYDGECGFCNHSVQFILNHRKNDHFRFVALQSDKAKEMLAPFNISISMETIYVIKNKALFQKSTAILKLSSDLKLPYSLLKIGFIVPRFIRDWLYGIISKNRHKLSAGFCALPSEDEKKLFLN